MEEDLEATIIEVAHEEKPIMKMSESFTESHIRLCQAQVCYTFIKFKLHLSRPALHSMSTDFYNNKCACSK